jgi:hypothetical protein
LAKSYDPNDPDAHMLLGMVSAPGVLDHLDRVALAPMVDTMARLHADLAERAVTPHGRDPRRHLCLLARDMPPLLFGGGNGGPMASAVSCGGS